MELQKRIEDWLKKMTLREKVSLLSGKDTWSTMPVERLGIPSLVMTDGPHGVRAVPGGNRKTGPATSFPTGIAMAASWDTKLIEETGIALAEETRALGCNILLGPCINIIRHPITGRNFETYSEDPYLAGQIGAAYVRGLQSRRIGACVKHFACNNQEIERFRGNSVVDERTLREIYLAAFETIVKEEKPWAVMSSYNRINGVYAAEHYRLLTEILREEWGFEGMVVSDWGGNHSTVASIKGGLDLEMPGPAKYYGNLLVEAVLTWRIDEETINRSVARVLRTILLSGQTDPASLPPGAINTPQHQALARKVAEESITLLKNDHGLLPLKKETLKSVAVIGPNAADLVISGGGSSNVRPPYCISPLKALQEKLGGEIKLDYAPGCHTNITPQPVKPEYLTPARGEGEGLWGEYFSGPDFSGPPVIERVDKKISFWWFQNGPDPRIKSPQFAVRWTGSLTVPAAGDYTFVLASTGESLLYLDERMILKNPDQAEGQEGFDSPRSATRVKLAAGRPYQLRIEYRNTAVDEDRAHITFLLGFNPDPEEEKQEIERAAALAEEADVAIVFAGMPEEFETEGTDRPDMELPGRQNELIQAVVRANPNTVVVLNCGAPVTMPWVNEVPAILAAYYPGQEGGNALAGILLGEINPSGKLPVTFPQRLEDTPAYINYPGTREVLYGEGIFVGYRYYDQRQIEPLFPFGHGLSYTSFAYGPLEAPATFRPGETVRVSVPVTNTGRLAGKEVVQLYIHDRQSSLPRPPKELKAFSKIELAPGETVTVHFELDQRAFSFYDPYKKQWIAEPGEFEILAGSSSRDIRAKTVITLVK